ncbi:acyl-CoA Delta-9 desaturase-like [Daphnia pulicaria]|uniref:acyl-CoA Delta-9 desaturase-like n=1 Tax=Daphnia pulicaria TaxID=35523 RepID=UPI001EEC158E|nr:acyl-CoA Delta-9 desaturase-like [Daphnia pulicaria]
MTSSPKSPVIAAQTANISNGKSENYSELTESTHPYIMEIIWRNVLVFIGLHVGALYGLLLFLTAAKVATLVWAYYLFIVGGFGIAAGAHKLWSHRSFKAILPFRILIAVAQTIALQDDIYQWSRDHRVHHKFSDTDADPYNSRRGFFFSHVGWLLCKKHPEVIRRGKTVDATDLLQDPVVVYQRKYYVPLALVCFALPAIVPWYFWGESFKTAFFVASVFRYVFTLHATWLTNSAAHIWGYHPYDKQMKPSDSRLAASFSLGEWHNYHHVFPGDYRVAELGSWRMSATVVVIDLFAWLGLIYDLKTVSPKIVRSRVLRTGDGTHPYALMENCPLTYSGDSQNHNVDGEIFKSGPSE